MYNKIIIVLINIFIYQNIFSQDTIYWKSNYKLNWIDFQSPPNSLTDIKAVSSSGIYYTLSYNEKHFTYKVICYFNKKASWKKIQSKNLLLHEQGHFDIAELFARKFRKSLSQLKFDPQTIKIEVKKKFIEINLEKDKMNALYDKETNFSKRKQKQIYWNNKIKSELHKLDSFS